jgi:hypothetical protein
MHKYNILFTGDCVTLNALHEVSGLSDLIKIHFPYNFKGAPRLNYFNRKFRKWMPKNLRYDLVYLGLGAPDCRYVTHGNTKIKFSNSTNPNSFPRMSKEKFYEAYCRLVCKFLERKEKVVIRTMYLPKKSNIEIGETHYDGRGYNNVIRQVGKDCGVEVFDLEKVLNKTRQWGELDVYPEYVHILKKIMQNAIINKDKKIIDL